MVGRVLKLGCFVLVGTIVMTGFLLSSSIEQHMAADYDNMTAALKARMTLDSPTPDEQLELLQKFINQDIQEASLYNTLLLGFVVVVLGGSALVVSMGTLYLNTRYLRPIEKKYADTLKVGNMWRTNTQQAAMYRNTRPNVTRPDDETLPHRPGAQSFSGQSQQRPHCEQLNKRYKANDKWTL